MACTGPDEFWHMACLVCAQCFRPFGKDLEYYDYNGREHASKTLRLYLRFAVSSLIVIS